MAVTQVNWPVAAASTCFLIMLLWTLFLSHDFRKRESPTFIKSLSMVFHAIPSLLLLGTTLVVQHTADPALIYLVALLVFRYWRTAVNIFFWYQYEIAKPAKQVKDRTVFPHNFTVIVPTVGPANNKVFREMVIAILYNEPAKLIFSTTSAEAVEAIDLEMEEIKKDIASGESSYQKEYEIGKFDIVTEYKVLNANVANKREQTVQAFAEVGTDYLIMVDDSAIWMPKFLEATLPAFQDSDVGLVGTRKWVKRIPYVHDPEKSAFDNFKVSYLTGFLNTIGALYLVRHNFEICATNAADGGVFCVSGRTCLIRTDLVKNADFTRAFLDEYVLRFPKDGSIFPGWGPVKADDDNFITRWVINHGKDIKIQSSKDSTITTVLGGWPEGFKFFPDQCTRWSRTTFRQNPIALLVDRTIWWKWPLTVWTTYLPWLYNAALIWDGLAIFTLTQTTLYSESSYSTALMYALVGFIWMSKLVKTLPWFLEHPSDFLWYFLIPAVPLFGYAHSILKLYTSVTFNNLTWSGREKKQKKEKKDE